MSDSWSMFDLERLASYLFALADQADDASLDDDGDLTDAQRQALRDMALTLNEASDAVHAAALAGVLPYVQMRRVRPVVL